MSIFTDLLSAISAIFLGYILYMAIWHPIRLDRTIARGSSKKTLAMLLAVVVAVPLILTGVARLAGLQPSEILGDDNLPEGHNLLISIISHFADPGNISTASHKGVFIALLTAFLGIVLLAGLMISTFVSIINRRMDNWRKGIVRYNNRNFNNYVVIIGGNEQVVNITKQSLQRSDVDFVLILTCQDVETFRLSIESRLEAYEEPKVVIYHGVQTSREDIESLHLEKAVEVYILGESAMDDHNGNHDAYNINSLKLISDYLKLHYHENSMPVITGRMECLKCHVAFEYQSTYTVYKYTNINKSLSTRIEFLPFNVYEIWARRVMVDNKDIYDFYCHNKDDDMPWTYKPLGTKQGINYESNKTVHLIIIGMNKMGVALATEAAQLMHFPNFTRDDRLRTTITFIDSNAQRESEYLKGRFANLFALARSRTIVCGQDSFDKPWYDPMEDENSRYHHLGQNFIDIEFEFIQGNEACEEVRQYMTEIATDTTHKICTVAVCIEHPQHAIATALYLPEAILKRAIQVLVYQRSLSDMVCQLSIGDDRWKRYRKLKPFGMLENCYEDDSLNDMKAKLANYFYARNKKGKPIDFHLAYQHTELTAEKLAEVLNIDTTDVRTQWKDLSIAYKWSNIYYIHGFAQKLRAIGSDVDKPYEEQVKTLQNIKDGPMMVALAQTEHNRWVTERLLMGFRPLDNTPKEWLFFDNDEMRRPADEQTEKRKIEQKEMLKTKNRAHLDIISNKGIDAMDYKMQQQDINNVMAIPLILKLSKLDEGIKIE